MRAISPALWAALAAATGAASGPLRIYYLGNSLTDELKYERFVELAREGGAEIVWGRHMIPGAPIRWLWGATNGFSERPYGTWPTALREYEWDVVTLQPFNPFESEFPYARLFCAEIAKRSPAAEVLIYAQWPGRGRGADWDLAFAGRTDASRAAGSDSYAARAAAVPAPWRERLAERSLRNEYELIVVSLNAERAMPRPVRLIPVGHVMQLLGQKMRVGLVPGYRTPWDFYSDGIHVNNVGSYVVACTLYATIFRRSPLDLPLAGYQGRAGEGADGVHIAAETARVVRESVWEVVATHPLCGVTSGVPVRIATPALVPAVAGEPYRMELLPAFGCGPYVWSHLGASLPAGLALSPEGVLGGTLAGGATNVELVVRVTDAAGGSATGRFALAIEPDRPPVIPDQPLPPLALGEYVEQQLRSESGNGIHRWTVADGSRLPPGLASIRMADCGVHPAARGGLNLCWPWKMATRGGPSGRSEDSRRSWGRRAATLPRARRLASVPTPEALVSGAMWDLRHPLHKLVQGAIATVSGRFDVAWTAVRVDDPTHDPFRWSRSLTGDHVILCLDAFNNREAVYNADDRFLPYPRGQRSPNHGAMIGPALGHACRQAEVPGGYLAVFEVSWKSLGLPSPMEAGRAIGLDVMIVDGGGGEGGARSVVVWQGTRENTSDPSRFGTVVLDE